MAIITIIFAAVLPQFRVIYNGWDSRQANTEVLQNGRVLIDHINRNLSKAVQITAVDPNVYIQFLDNDGNNWRYDINTTSRYVEFGLVGNLSDLAGPVSSLKFTCYDGNNFTNAITDGNSIRFVDVETTLPNPAALGQNKTFTASVYLRANAYNGGIVGCWRLDETSGTTAADSSGNGNNGTLVNMTAPGCWVAGQIGNALTFDGTDDFVEVPDDPSFDIANEITITAWINPDDADAWRTILSKFAHTPGWRKDLYWFLYNGNIGASLTGPFGGEDWLPNVPIPTGTWTHVALTYNGSTMIMYKDGANVASTNVTGTLWLADSSSNESFYLGTNTEWGEYFDGIIDDVRIYNRALTAAEIAQLANILNYRGFNEAKALFDTNTSIAVPIPTGTSAGDLLIAAVATDGSTTISPPSSEWDEIDQGSDTGEVTLGAWWKLAGASETSPTFTWTGGGQQAYGWTMRFTGHNPTPANTINAWSAGSDSNSTPTSPDVNTTVDNCLILRLGAFDDDDVNTLPEPGNPGLTGHTAITMDESASSAGPTYQAAGTAQSGRGAITVAWPAHQAGDIALLFVESCGGEAVTLSTSAGFANITNSPQATGTGTAGTRITVFWCRATSSSMSSPVVADPGDHVYGRILTFRNVVATGDPWDVTAGGTKATASITTTFEAVTTSVNNTLIVLAASRDNDATAAAWSNWTNANLSSLTERSDRGTTSGNGGGIGVATGVKSTAGDTGSTTATVTSSVDGHMTIALKPPTGTVSGGAGYVKQSAAGSSGTSTFSLNSSNEARMLTIAIAPDVNGSYDCCGDYIQP